MAEETTHPRFVLMKYFPAKLGFFGYGGDHRCAPNSIVVEYEKGAFNTLAKIELEPSTKMNSNYYHFRLCHVNKYFEVNNTKDGFVVVAKSDKPEEDRSKFSCTLFEPIIFDKNGNFELIHVHTGWNAYMHPVTNQLCVSEKKPNYRKFSFVDWESIVILPEHVAFKGDNGKYLQAHNANDTPYLQFSSDDPNSKASGFTIEQRPDGSIRIKSDYYDRYLRLSPNWIWADGNRGPNFSNLDDVFWVSKFDGNVIALRNGATTRYCARLSADGKVNCLNAAASTITNEARMEVKELVSERKIYGVNYRMEDKRIFDEMPYVAGKTTVFNKGDLEGSVEAELTYDDDKSYTFTRGISMTAGVTASIETGVPFIVEGKIEVSLQITGSLEWSHTESIKKTVKATGKVPVPPRSTAVVHYVGTKGSCSIPYTYTRQDKRSTDSKIVYSKQIDGIYTGINCYNFEFVMDKPQRIG